MRELIRHILKEETEEIDQKVMNFLMRRYEIKEFNNQIHTDANHEETTWLRQFLPNKQSPRS